MFASVPHDMLCTVPSFGKLLYSLYFPLRDRVFIHIMAGRMKLTSKALYFFFASYARSSPPPPPRNASVERNKNTIDGGQGRGISLSRTRDALRRVHPRNDRDAGGECQILGPATGSVRGDCHQLEGGPWRYGVGAVHDGATMKTTAS